MLVVVHAIDIDENDRGESECEPLLDAESFGQRGEPRRRRGGVSARAVGWASSAMTRPSFVPFDGATYVPGPRFFGARDGRSEPLPSTASTPRGSRDYPPRMRYGPPLLLLVVASSSAYADNGLSLELGYLRNRVAVTDHTALGGEAVRFTIKVSHATNTRRKSCGSSSMSCTPTACHLRRTSASVNAEIRSSRVPSVSAALTPVGVDDDSRLAEAGNTWWAGIQPRRASDAPAGLGRLTA